MKKMNIRGIRENNRIQINGMELSPNKSQNIMNHSPDGFAWGYSGSGPAQLALAICLEVYEEPKALAFYQLIKTNLVGRLPQADFSIAIWMDEDEPLVFFEDPPVKSYQFQIARMVTFTVQGRTPGDATRHAFQVEQIHKSDVINEITPVDEILRKS